MKRTVIFFVAVAVVVLSTTIFAGEPPRAARNMELIETNYLNGLNSDNIGLKTSSAYFLGEIKSGKAVLALMHTLHTGKTECVRIMAALALTKIGDSRGIYAVKGAAKFDNSELVRQRCAGFYYDYVRNNKTK